MDPWVVLFYFAVAAGMLASCYFLLCCTLACRAGLFSEVMAAVRLCVQRSRAELLRAVRACCSTLCCCCRRPCCHRHPRPSCRWSCCRHSRAAETVVTTMEDIISEHRAVMEDLAGSTSLVGHAPPQPPQPRPCCCIGCTVQFHCCGGTRACSLGSVRYTGGREVVPAPPVGTCAVCQDEGLELVVPTACAHQGGLCGACMAQFLRTKAGDAASFPVTCCIGDCDVVLSPSVAHLLLGDGPVYDNYLRFHLRAMLGVALPCPVCRGVLWVERGPDNGGGERQLRALRCNHCATRVCVPCGTRWHEGQTCAAVRATTHAAATEEATRALLAQAKQCPRCGEGIVHYRGHGCHHIKPGGGCPRCGHHFCYVCLGNFRTCGCPFQGSSFCRTGRGGDCGCPPCPVCRPGQPCIQCCNDGRCRSCSGAGDATATLGAVHVRVVVA